MLENPAFTFTLALAAAMAAHVVASHLRLPGIVVLLATGVVLGPDIAGVIRPDTLGGALEMIVGLSVAVILFEGGLHLNIGRLRSEAVVIRRLITIGSIVTALGSTLAARWLMGWEWGVAVVFGTLVIVTGPTVITPLLRRIRVNKNVSTILEAEGVLNDPIGAILAVVALDVVLAGTEGGLHELLGVPARLGLGVAAGLAGGAVIAVLFRNERMIPEGLANVVVLSLVLVVFQASELIQEESGIMAATVAGLVVGNVEHVRVSRELREFKGQLTILFVGLLFVLLAADVRLADLEELGWAGVATVLALIVIVRPLNVLASTVGSALNWRERAFLMWLAPRGVVAAAVASVFAHRLEEAGYDVEPGLRAMVFLVIAATVVAQGLSGGIVARMLGVRRRSDEGWAIVGANGLGRALARALALSGEQVVLVDSNVWNAERARAEGLQVVHGNANDDDVLERADVGGRRALIAMTTNEGTNLLLAEKVRISPGVPLRLIALQREQQAVSPDRAAELGARILFGAPIDVNRWAREIPPGDAGLRAWRHDGAEELDAPALVPPEGDPLRLPLVVLRDGTAHPFDARSRIRTGDVVVFAIRPGGEEEPPGAWTPIAVESLRSQKAEG